MHLVRLVNKTDLSFQGNTQRRRQILGVQGWGELGDGGLGVWTCSGTGAGGGRTAVSVPNETAVPCKAPGFLLCELNHSGKRAASFLSNEVTP